MKVIYGSRSLEVPLPAKSDLLRMVGRKRLQKPTVNALHIAFTAGALAALREIESKRGTQRERELMEAPYD